MQCSLNSTRVPLLANCRFASVQAARARIDRIDAANGVLVSPSLVDNFARGHDYLRISLTERCNLRCTYCMPAEGVPLSPKENMLSTAEIIRLARLFISQGVNKIRLTGGEPTLRHDLPEIISHLAPLPTLGITTNGIALDRKLPDLVNAGLTHVNLSLDTLDPFKFEIMTRRRGHASVMSALQKSISLLVPVGQNHKPGQNLKNVKLNVVVIKGVNDMEVPAFVDLARKERLSVRFIEYMPFDDNSWSTKKLVPSSDLLESAKVVDPTIVSLIGRAADTAKQYAGQGWQGSIGFISSMTDHFCGGCSRLRLTADGRLKTCLFGEPQLDLRNMIRSGAGDSNLLESISTALRRKKYAHDGKSKQARLPSQPVEALCQCPISAVSDFNANTSHLRAYTSKATKPSSVILSHLDESGNARMVDVGEKKVTRREATAVGTIYLSPEAFGLLTTGKNKKGDVLTIAKVAGIMAAKKTSALIPLCHPISLAFVQVELEPVDNRVEVKAVAACNGQTGVEMEALTAVSGALLTIYDMVKSAGHAKLSIGNIRLVGKTGGKSDYWQKS